MGHNSSTRWLYWLNQSPNLVGGMLVSVKFCSVCELHDLYTVYANPLPGNQGRNVPGYCWNNCQQLPQISVPDNQLLPNQLHPTGANEQWANNLMTQLINSATKLCTVLISGASLWAKCTQARISHFRAG